MASISEKKLADCSTTSGELYDVSPAGSISVGASITVMNGSTAVHSTKNSAAICQSSLCL